MYQRTQVAYGLVISILAINALVVAWIERSGGPRTISILVVVLAVAVCIPMSTMTIRVTPDAVDWWLTGRFFRQRVLRSEILEIRARRRYLPFYGIKIEGNATGWVMSGTNVVALTLRNGKEVWLGTSGPHGLLAALDPHCARSSA